jgi:hypothetical protein
LLFKKSSRNANDRNFINTNPIGDMKAACYPQTGLNSRKAIHPLLGSDLEWSSSMILTSEQPSTSQQKSNLGGKGSFLMSTHTNNFMIEEP